MGSRRLVTDRIYEFSKSGNDFNTLRVLSVAVISAFFFFFPALAQSPNSDCYKLGFEVSAGSVAGCVAAADDRSANVSEQKKGIAWGHAARSLALQAPGEMSVEDASRAADYVFESMERILPTDRKLLYLTDDSGRRGDRDIKADSRKGRARAPLANSFLFERAMILARAQGRLVTSGQCNNACIDETLGLMSEVEPLLGADPSGNSLWRSEYFYRAAQLEQSRQPIDYDGVISSYQQVQSGPFLSPARQAIAQLATDAGDQAVARRTQDAYARAVDYFQAAVLASPADTTAWQKKGLAHLALGRDFRQGVAEFELAEEAFAQIDAKFELGTTYSAWADFLERTDPRAVGQIDYLRAEAVAAFEASGSNSSDAQARRLKSLADASMRAEDFKRAAEAYGQEGQIRVGGSLAGEAFFNQAVAIEADAQKARRPVPYDQVETALRRASAADMSSAKIAAAFGEALLQRYQDARSAADLVEARQQFLGEARQQFQRIRKAGTVEIENGQTVSYASMGDQQQFLGEAFYGLSLVEGANGNAGPRAISLADQAVVNAVSDDGKFRRNACLMRVLAGGDWVTDDDNEVHCLTGGTSDTNLVKAMFLMRRAAQLRGGARIDGRRAELRRQARSLIQLNQNDAVRLEGFGIPGEPDMRLVPADAALIFLQEISEVCNYEGGRAELPPRYSRYRSDALNFWRFYKLDLCVP
ncbi:MAG: hypothetical protein AAGJ29_00165 [Pseudomonadota bacterium]